ncbi:CpaF family protein [Amycolatopsis benzoatilytica]|uniref:CpaF family protein n=1 Tax=Amycolatopsis benzoatilytica TaxID=346045 RepID=UPI0003812D6F|nr:ATPase, T2SS/T4P/T4SS family [Amycolatopsis benzoatilytica]
MTDLHRREPAGGNDAAPADSAESRLKARLLKALESELPRRLRAVDVADVAFVPVSARRDTARGVLSGVLAQHDEDELAAGRVLPGSEVGKRLVEQVLDEVFGLGGLEALLADPEVETIVVNRFDRVFVQYASGRREQVAAVAGSNEELTELVRSLAARASSEERRFDRGSPALNLQLPDGARMFAVLGLTAGGVTACTIRRHRYLVASLAKLRTRGTIDVGLERFLRAVVRARKNVLITGGTGAGKTTLLRALASEMGAGERIVTVEDAFELGLDRDPRLHADVVALQAREANVEGEGAVDQAMLVRWSLRMNPDRVIVGEIRGPEVIPMCNAMSQGNDGSMATIHASSSGIAFTRLASYAAQSPERLPLETTALLVASAVHFVVHLARTADRSTRAVASIREVVGAEHGLVISNEIYRPGPDGRAVPIAGALRTDTLDELVSAGFDVQLLAQPTGWWPR